jgi:HPt (histidine-containing phosphotransfer) domain-containing protein
MAEIGTVASVLQLADIATKTSLQLYELISTIRRAPDEIQAVNRDVFAFNTLVCSLTTSLSTSQVREIVEQDAEIENSLKMLQVPMESCNDSYERLMEKLKPYLQPDEGSPEASDGRIEGGNAKGKSGSQRVTWSNFTWFFRRREVYPLITELDRAKTTFGDAMGGVTLYVSYEQKPV